MTQEEKAKAYDEVLERAREFLNSPRTCFDIEQLTDIFPELRESEDERIRKSLIKFLTDIKRISESGRTTWAVRKEDAEMCKSSIAWLEKQKEPESTSASMMIPSCWEVEQKLNPDKVKLIRHCIGLILTDATDKRFKDYGLTLKDCLTWLGEQKEEEGYEAIPVESTLEYKLGFKAGKESEKQKECFADSSKTSASEDERIRKVLVSIVKWLGSDSSFFTTNSVTKSEVLAYLEKQKEQKPAEWSEEDEKNCNRIIRFLEPHKTFFPTKETKEEMQNWIKNRLKSLRPQAKQEWSEEDEVMLANIFGTYKTLEDMLDLSTGQDRDILESMNFERDWLKDRFKSLCLQPKQEWSEEDERMLSRCMKSIEFSKQFADSDTFKLAKDKEIIWLENRFKFLSPQPKQELSEEEFETFRKTLAKDAFLDEITSRRVAKKLLDSVKSLRPSWKPSKNEERLINTSISFLKDFADKGYENAVECIDWLKSKLNGNSCK